MDYSANIVMSKHNNSSEASCLHKHPGDLCHELDVKCQAEITLQTHFAEDNNSSEFFSTIYHQSNDAIHIVLIFMLDLNS